MVMMADVRGRVDARWRAIVRVSCDVVLRGGAGVMGGVAAVGRTVVPIDFGWRHFLGAQTGGSCDASGYNVSYNGQQCMGLSQMNANSLQVGAGGMGWLICCRTGLGACALCRTASRPRAPSTRKCTSGARAISRVVTPAAGWVQRLIVRTTAPAGRATVSPPTPAGLGTLPRRSLVLMTAGGSWWICRTTS